jgi:hypothetical protein
MTCACVFMGMFRDTMYVCMLPCMYVCRSSGVEFLRLVISYSFMHVCIIRIYIYIYALANARAVKGQGDP